MESVQLQLLGFGNGEASEQWAFDGEKVSDQRASIKKGNRQGCARYD